MIILKSEIVAVMAMLFIKAFFIESMGIIWVLCPIWIPAISITVTSLSIGYVSGVQEYQRLKNEKNEEVNNV